MLMSSKVNKPSEILIKTSNITEYSELDIQILRHQEQMILSSSMYEKTHLLGSFGGFIDAIQVSSL